METKPIITRRWTDEQIGQAGSSRLVATNAESNFSALNREKPDQSLENQKKSETSIAYDDDFEAASIARIELQKVIEKFEKDAKPSTRLHFRLPHKSAKTKTIELLQGSLDEEMNSLKASIDSLEGEWKQNHGMAYAAFHKIFSTLDNHKSILKIFPSQNNYASPLVGSLTILIKAAKSHSEIALTLSKSIADISEKVTTCSMIINIIRTPRTRKKLADIYARMFQFYQNTLEWYLQSRYERFMRSFNENLLKTFEDAKKDLEDSITELFREVAVANTAMVAVIEGKLSVLETELVRQRRNYEARDTVAGKRLEKTLEALWAGINQIESTIELASLRHSAPQNQLMQDTATTLACDQANDIYNHDLNAFIIEDQVPSNFTKRGSWIVEKDVIHRLQTWITDDAVSRTMWISSPHHTGAGVSGASAAVFAVVAAAWQAETPILTAFCRRPRPDQLRPGMSTEQVGLISLVYRLIRQLLQFNQAGDNLAMDMNDFRALNGEASSWDASLRVLQALLQNMPVITFCTIDNLNELEWGGGRKWCSQLLVALRERQLHVGSSFNILLSTTGQSLVLPQYVMVKDRYIAPKSAKEFGRIEKGPDLRLG